MTITPLLWFRGDCQDAFTLYERAFRGTIVTMLTYAASKAGPDRAAGLAGEDLPRDPHDRRSRP